MSKKFRRFYETAFDSKISKSDEDLLSADKQDAAIAHRLSNQLQLSASASSVQLLQCDADHGAIRAPATRQPPKNRFLGFLLSQKRRNSGGGGGQRFNSKYRSSDSMVTSSSLSLESITSDSLSSHSSESPCYKLRFPEPHVLSPISDKSSQDAGAEILQDFDRRRSSATATVAVATAPTASSVVKAKPPQSLGLIKLNKDHHQHHGSDSGISVGSKPGDSYQELLDVPFDMPKLRRKQKSQVFHHAEKSTITTTTTNTTITTKTTTTLQCPSDGPSELPFDMPKLRRRQNCNTTNSNDAALPFDMPKLRKRQMESCARVISLDFEIGSDLSAYNASRINDCQDHDNVTDRSECEQLEELPFDFPKLRKTNLQDKDDKKPDRSSLFLNVLPDNCSATISPNNRALSKTFQNKNQPNRPTLSLSNIKPLHYVEDVDVSLPLDQQCWYHGPMNRLEAEKTLHGQEEGCYLVRGNKGSYALSIKSAKGFIHMRITQSGNQNYLGHSDRPFGTIPDLIRHYTLNKLPAKGAEHVGLIRPLIHQML
ncbi:uncharacterized protein LOC112693682 [Sipha flava]|uniref:Uncharacterized protein LOC112693682 n=1 Tax=Sipha flava TaxID=143950 RepID=A0A8B8GNR8_9HEMI|nr:uncharacterized protein LOC112693682 [Sipha flava]